MPIPESDRTGKIKVWCPFCEADFTDDDNQQCPKCGTNIWGQRTKFHSWREEREKDANADKP